MKSSSVFSFRFHVYLRGIMMGAADLIPGVSGGTIALITGIYEEFIFSLSALFEPEHLRFFFRGQWKKFWKAINGNFLFSLFAGILTSVLLFSSLIRWLFSHYPVHVWSFFFGLIAASSLMVLRMAGPHKGRWFFVAGGLLAGLLIAWLHPAQASGNVTLLMTFLSGMSASMAMILPGISGSYILILLGMYATVLEWVHRFDLLHLGIFVAGIAAGITGFSRLLRWLLAHYEKATLSLLGGFLVGSLALIWPWKSGGVPVWPSNYPGNPHVWTAAGLALAGLVFIFSLERAANK